jgi:hypothetical protein
MILARLFGSPLAPVEISNRNAASEACEGRRQSRAEFEYRFRPARWPRIRLLSREASLDPVQRFLLSVSEMSKDDDDLVETEQPMCEVSDAPRKRRSKDRSHKLMTAFRPVRSRRR